MPLFQNLQIPSTHTAAIRGATPAQQKLFSHLLSQWGIREDRSPQPGGLTLRLSDSGATLLFVYGERVEERISLPARVETLWLALQEHLFDPPRQHYRIPLGLRGRLSMGGRSDEFHCLSLSEGGLRFEFHRELVRDEELEIELPFSDFTIAVSARVIYCFPSRLNERMVIGVAFDSGQDGQREALRDFLVQTSLQRARREMPRDTFREAVTLFDLPERTRRALLD